MKSQWLACLALTLGACPSVTVDDNEGLLGPTVEFDPGNRIIPFPNNLLLNPATGKLNLPEQCNESASSTATRVGTLNTLDGFGTYQTTINVTFTEAVDLASLAGRVLVFQRVAGGEGTDPLTAVPIPVVPIPGMTQRFTDQTNIKACTDPVAVNQVTFVPLVPLEQKSTYTVAVLSGIKTANNTDFNPSFTWSLVREPQPVVLFDEDNNVTLNRTPLDPVNEEDKATLVGVDLLWNAHHSAITYLGGTGNDSEDLLLAFEFNTQTISDPLDPEVEGSPAADLTAAPLIGNLPIGAVVPGLTARTAGTLFQACLADDPIGDTQCFLRVALGASATTDPAQIYNTGKTLCLAAGCAAVGELRSSLTLSKQYRADVDNPGYAGTGAQKVPGAWSNPISPDVAHNTDNPNPLLNDVQARLETLVLIPNAAICPLPAAGYPTAIFQHGITRSKNDVFGVMGALTSNCITVVAIDASNHGSRAVRISNAANAISALDCTDVNVGLTGPRPDRGPDPTAKSSCYAPIFSSDLAATRDGFRQSILDLHQLAASVKACGTTACGAVKVDANRIAYVGHSLGGIFGGMFTATSLEIAATVLDVGAAGWIDILENTDQTVAFQCPLVNALIDAGSLTGDKFDPANPTVGLCLTDAWKTEPGYRQFATIGRWVLDPADPANYASRLAGTKFLLQRVTDDEVFPNLATDNMGALATRLKGDASCGIPVGANFPPSTALLSAPTQSLYLDYLTVPPGTAGCVSGNTFGHGSLLKPEASVVVGTCNPAAGPPFTACDGSFATQRLQTDAVFFLLVNLGLLGPA